MKHFKQPDVSIPIDKHDPMNIEEDKNANRYINKTITINARFLNRDKFGRLHFCYDDNAKIHEKLIDVNNSIRDYFKVNKSTATPPESAQLYFCTPFDAKPKNSFNVALDNKDREDLVVFIGFMAVNIKDLKPGYSFDLSMKVRFVDSYQKKTNIHSRGWKLKLIKMENTQ